MNKLCAWLRRVRKRTKPPVTLVAGWLEQYADCVDKLGEAPDSCRLNCANAMLHNHKETEYVTGCEWHLPLQKKCRECPYWSESRHFAELGRLVREGFEEGVRGAETEVKT